MACSRCAEIARGPGHEYGKLCSTQRVTNQSEARNHVKGQTPLESFVEAQDTGATRSILCPKCKEELRALMRRAGAGDGHAKEALLRKLQRFQTAIFGFVRDED